MPGLGRRPIPGDKTWTIRTLLPSTFHTHAEVSCWNPFDNYGEEYDRAADKYFKNSRRPTIEETIAYYRERKIGLIMFTVDSESKLGRRRIPNEEIAEAAQKNSDMMMAFASIDPHKGKMGAREAERLIKEYGVKGFKFHPTVQGYHPYDRWPGPSTKLSMRTRCRRSSTPAQRHRQRHALRRRLAARILQSHAP